MNESGSSLFLIDGFPRNQNNLEGWEKEMSDKVNVLFVLFFDAPEEVCVERCLSRGQAGSGRSDDNPESLKKRVNTYVNDTMPIVNHFYEKSLVRKVNAALDPEQVSFSTDKNIACTKFLNLSFKSIQQFNFDPILTQFPGLWRGQNNFQRNSQQPITYD